MNEAKWKKTADGYVTSTKNGTARIRKTPDVGIPAKLWMLDINGFFQSDHDTDSEAITEARSILTLRP